MVENVDWKVFVEIGLTSARLTKSTAINRRNWRKITDFHQQRFKEASLQVTLNKSQQYNSFLAF